MRQKQKDLHERKAPWCVKFVENKYFLGVNYSFNLFESGTTFGVVVATVYTVSTYFYICE